jgi:histidinol-phosphate phosphatase family protein
MATPVPNLESENRILFLDRDGTIIKYVPYLCEPDQVEIEYDCPGALQVAISKGFKLVVVSNQSAIGRGYCELSDVERVNNQICELFAKEGVFFDEVLICPHAPRDNCLCRKPKTGLVRKYFSVRDNQRWIMIGDSLSDIEFGNRLSAKCILYQRKEFFSDTKYDFKQVKSWKEIGRLFEDEYL